MSNSRVLVTPLDWGLGHATRCIPVIRALRSLGCSVQIGGSGKSLLLLRNEFPDLKWHELPAYAPEYPKSGSMVWKLLQQVPKFIKAIRSENIRVAEIVQSESINLVISDNRYGAWSNKVPGVFITHQLNILPPRYFGWSRPLLRLISFRLIKKFSTCWIPDLPTRKLTGDLSLPFKRIDIVHIGTLSRFTKPKTFTRQYDILVLLSGPEPQRGIFEAIIMDQLKDCNKRILVVRGLPGEHQDEYSHAQIKVVNSLGSEELQSAIASAAIVIARSGYSTIMDLSVFGSKSILIPTPGQTEQIYLAGKLHRKGIVYSCNQKDFQLQPAILKAQKLKRPFPENDSTLLSKAIEDLVNSIE